MGQFAWVTLATNDSYALGALVVAFSLKKVNTVHQLAVLITPGVTQSMREKLRTVFNLVQEVNVLDSKDAANLALLSRPELGITFTKLHCWRLTQYEKCVFLDADTLVLQNSDELFEREELSAAPDVGWPDCFNSGVFVFRPNLETFDKLTQFAVQKGSFDGGDQGLLNSFFANWATSDSSRRLPFTYNTCSTACYSYLPAFKQFGDNVKILHFIGQLKPWLINFDPVAKKPNPPQEYKHLADFLDLWWGIFVNQVHPKLATDMGGLAGALAGLKLGVARTPEQEAYENNCRRSYWEHGNIDYLGSEIKERTIQETASDGRQITKKIFTLEGTQYEEIEEWETSQVGDKKTVQHRQHTTPKRPIDSKTDKKPSPAAEAALKELVSKEVVIVPGHTKEEFDAETNTRTITEKTTTGFQVTKIITFPDGRTKTQTTTFYDPIAVPVGEDEYEEVEEEEEIIEEEESSGYQPSQVKNTNTNTSNVAKNTNQNQQLTNVDQKQVAKNTVSTVGEQTQVSKQVTQVSQQQTTVVSKSTKTTSETHTQSTKTQQTQQTAQQSIKNTQTTQNTENIQNTQNTQQIVKKDNDTNKPVAAPSKQVAVPNTQVAVPNQPRTTVIKKKLDTGEEIEIHTTISEDGLTKTCRRIVTKPAEELEVTDYEEIHEPGQLKTRKVSHQTTSSQVTEVTQNVHGQVQQQNVKQQQIREQIEEHTTKQTTKNVTDQKQTNVTDQKQLKNVDTTTNTVDEKHVLTKQEIEKLLEKQKNTNTKTIIKEISSLTVEQIEQIIEYTITIKKTTKITIITEEIFEELKKVQQVKITQRNTQQKNTQQQQQQLQQQTTTQKNVSLTQEQRDEQEIEMRRQMAEKKKQTDVDERFTKNENETTSIEKYDVTNMEKTFKTRGGQVVTRPDTNPGEKTTEEVRYFPGGVEYTWHTVGSDGSARMSMRTFYDPVPCTEEEAKKKLPAAHASNVDAHSGLKK